MRLWSISPSYLDSKGLVALWREGLLAQKVLLGKTKGYKNHPQLKRFRNENIGVLGYYLSIICHEAKDRGYNFDLSKIPKMVSTKQLTVTRGQLEYEFNHLQNKLNERDREKFLSNEWQSNKTVKDESIFNSTGYKYIKNIETHSLFKVVEGNIESWEKVKKED